MGGKEFCACWAEGWGDATAVKSLVISRCLHAVTQKSPVLNRASPTPGYKETRTRTLGLSAVCNCKKLRNNSHVFQQEIG